MGPLGSRLGGIPVRTRRSSPVIGALSSGHSGHPSPNVPSNRPASAVRAVGLGGPANRYLAPGFPVGCSGEPELPLGPTGSRSGHSLGRTPLSSGVPTAELLGPPAHPVPSTATTAAHRGEPAPEWDGNFGCASLYFLCRVHRGVSASRLRWDPLSMAPGLWPSGWLLGTLGNIDTP